ncbi:ATP-dependent nuclease [Agrobacterium pusense]|uniref:ATP-dependent nuclease n=1 Tax=Agrobacterium pusense TaxID=648995 RepID=UPI0022B8C6A3|nr:AAA family ATPase [Agrobacterium pusense]MCZ7929529.1 AAA family ATPase [Agrobacterium pusense]
MKLVAFSVENYRSITNARKIPVSDYSLLIGANNEGKSNILHALKLAMDALVEWHTQVIYTKDGKLVRIPHRRPSGFHWNTDYPISKQSKYPKGKCNIILEFALNDTEIAEFRTEIKSNLNGTLPILFEFGHDPFEVSVQKPGKGYSTLNRKSARIADFVSRRIRFEYIPSVRTASEAGRVINKLLDGELGKLDDDLEYKSALEAIEHLQKPVLDALAETIQRTVAGFLPNVRSVKLETQKDARRTALRRSVNIIIDDGNETYLERKGDGVQSLVALAMMRHASERNSREASTIIAIEEPEAHLHPSAVHELRAVIEELSSTNQIVLSSHSPLFVNPTNLKNTIIVKESRAKCADHVSEIRDALGVRFSDNLHNASIVVLVEGSDDVGALTEILSQRSEKIKAAISSGMIALDHLSGASSLSQKASFYASSACQLQCFLDDDDAGRRAVNKAISAKTVKIVDVTLCAVPHLDESELEDLYDKNVYQNAFFTEFGVDIKLKVKGKTKQKWSDNVERLFTENGKPWSDQIKQSVKNWLSDFARKNAASIVNEQLASPLNNFIRGVEKKIDQLEA